MRKLALVSPAVGTLLALLAIPSVFGQPAAPVISPEVNSDRSVTFRLRAPNAQQVLLGREGAERVAMQKDVQGIWAVTTPPLEPDYYGYSFIVDGVSMMDPVNPRFKPNLLGAQSVVHVPGPASITWEVNDVPHGTLHRHFYKSTVVGDQRDYFVYTPPSYTGKGKPLPVLYLLHGFSDDASGWTSVGHAHVIMDNLIAQGKAKPMLVVMTLGYGAPEILSRNRGPRQTNLWQKNMTGYRDALFNEVIPAVEKAYRVSKDRRQRAITGLSMGGAESLYTGLNALDRFAWIGAFSSGGLGDNFAEIFPKLDAKANQQLKLLWIACGKQDRLIDANRKFLEFLKSKDVHYTWKESEGAHTWMVWRRYLSEFVPMLF